MAISPRQQLLNFHASNYVRATMADRLKQEGFVSMNNDGIHWFRVTDRKVVQTVIFYTPYTEIPVALFITFGCFPLFVTPFFPPSVYIYSLPHMNQEVIYPGRPICKEHNRYAYSKDILVWCPADELSGADFLDGVLDVLENTKDEESCYAYHKSKYITLNRRHLQRDESTSQSPFTFASVDFMNEVVYFNDLDILSDCEKCLTMQLEDNYYQQSRRKLSRYELHEMARRERLKEALSTDLQEYRNYLEELKLQTIKLLEKKVGIYL